MTRRRKGPDQSGALPPDGEQPTYRHPVPEPGALLDRLREEGVPMSLPDLAAAFEVRGERAQAALKKRLQEMSAAGQLLVNRRGEYCLLEKLSAIAGTLSAHRDGYGFLAPDDGSPDIFLPAHEMNQLLDGDRVAVRLTGGGRAGRRAGALVEILARGRSVLVGRYQRKHGVGYVSEAGRALHQFVIPEHHRADAQPGELVRMEILEYPAPGRSPQGRITDVLGDPKGPGVVTAAAIEIFGLPSGTSAAVSNAASKLGTRVSRQDLAGRKDLRALPLVTIDGEDARDFDDAVFAEPAGEGWRLVVAIADVSHYVRDGDAIDQDARARGTSVYFPDQVVPMLPEALSNELCSLKPEVDRLAMVCDMQVDPTGKVTRSRFYRAVIHSHARLTYDEVDQALRGVIGPPRTRLARLMPQLEGLLGVFRVLVKARDRRGALDLDLPEVKIEMDAQGRVLSVAPRPRNDAHRLIEECMVAANVEAARYIGRHRLATLYRVHPGPDPDKFEELRLMLQAIGIPVADTAARRARELNRALARIRERPDADNLMMMVLRSLSQAVYQPQNIGHFGLALQYYAHFTSPIRRYPDLLVHRAIGHILDAGRPGDFGYGKEVMEHLGRVCSALERRADQAARHVEARHKCMYIEHRIGEEMSGVITGVKHFGLFVMLDEVYVDGLLHVSNLHNDYYQVADGGLALVGEHGGRQFRLGDKVRVKVLRVDIDEAQVDFALVSGGEEASREAARPPRRGGFRRRRR